MSDPTILFLFPIPPTPDFSRNYFVNELRAAGFLAEYWDIGRLVGYDMAPTYEPPNVITTRICSFREFWRKLDGLQRERVIVVAQVSRSLESLPIYLALNHFGIKAVFFGRGYVPNVRQSETGVYDLVRRILRTKNRGAMLVTLASIALYKALPIIKKYEIAFVSGTMAERIHSADSIRMSRIDHYDVDNASRLKTAALPGLPDPYAVFIDEFLPHHPDMDTFGANPVNAADYYRVMNGFFDYYEQKHDTTVVIAAHPKATYDSNPFGRRQIVYNSTNQLISQASLVFAHVSTAIAYAVIHGKPLCLIYMDQTKIIHPNQFDPMVKSAERLGCPLLDIQDNREADLVEYRVDKAKYASYYREFLSARDDRRRTSAEIVVDEMTALLRGETAGA